MATQIDNLDDSSLLHIFNFLDPFDWLSIEQVCTRWKRTVQRSFKQITGVHLGDSQFCSRDVETHRKELKRLEEDDLKKVLQHVGQNVMSVVLGHCPCNAIYLSSQNQFFSFESAQRFDHKKIIRMVSQTCTNMVELKIAEPYLHSEGTEEIIKSSKTLRKVILPKKDLALLPKFINKSIEEITLKVCGDSKLANFHELFPNINKLTMYLHAPLRQNLLLDPILQRVKQIKSLCVINETYFPTKYDLGILSNISVLSELEELFVWDDGQSKQKVELTSESVDKLLEGCRNLRTVVLDIALGSTDVSTFLKLPKLEYLSVKGAKLFSSESLNGIEQTQFESVTNLQIKFNEDESLDFSGLLDGIKKMPALKYLAVEGLSEEQTYELTCSIIEIRVTEKDIIVTSADGAPYETIRVLKKRSSELSPEPLRLVVESQGKEYGDGVKKFVQNLGECSVVAGERKIVPGRGYRSGIYDRCFCLMRACSSSEESDDSDDHGFNFFGWHFTSSDTRSESSSESEDSENENDDGSKSDNCKNDDGSESDNSENEDE